MTMLTAAKLLARGAGLAKALVARAPFVSLDWDQRLKSRLEVEDSAGTRFAIFLPRGTVLRGGDVLVRGDGTFVRVLAAPQPVMEVRPCGHHGHHGHVHNPSQEGARGLMRAAYHLGNRHVPVDVQADHLKFEPDHVLADMLRGMHFDVVDALAAFEPEGGAYHVHAGHGHGHDHDHDDHDHDHAHD